MKVVIEREIRIYATKDNQTPFLDWLESIKDKKLRYRIKERMDRIALGNLGDHKYLIEGVFEFRLDFGSGYRIYFGEEQKKIILLLCAGDKSTQKKDICKAVSYWKDYLSR